MTIVTGRNVMGEKDETAETDPVADEAAEESLVEPIEGASETGERDERAVDGGAQGDSVGEGEVDPAEDLSEEAVETAGAEVEGVDPAPDEMAAEPSAESDPEAPTPEAEPFPVDPIPEAESEPEPVRAGVEPPQELEPVAAHGEAAEPPSGEAIADEGLAAPDHDVGEAAPTSVAPPPAEEEIAASVVEAEVEPLSEASQPEAQGVAIAAAFLRPENPDADGPGADATIQYAKRASRADRQDWGWWVDGDHLVESDGKGATRRTHLGDILEVQTAAAPAKFRPWRHQTVLGLRDSRRIEIDNAHYVGVANYEERSASYAPFVRELIEAIGRKAPYAKARRGASYLGYVGMLAFVIVLIVLMAALLFLLPIEGVPGIVFIKAGLVALMAPPLLAWVVKSRPSGMPLSQLPPGALPQAKP